MPTRPAQSSEEQTLRWAARRQSVGARIREIRLAQDLSQEALALESGLSRNMIIGIEWGRKSVAYERLWDIADVLDVPVTDFLRDPKGPAASKPFRGGRRPMRDAGS
ncbi:helix-turn-helix transcriptional regulator [Arthrobacter sp. efr-133-R2A-63]|uniref:helix-turn-helix domain-containing protein n=1 Tax=Arthrobacter sp. efr-133-R2A-63 TaxID=3040278 RepID=UPI0033077ECF